MNRLFSVLFWRYFYFCFLVIRVRHGGIETEWEEAVDGSIPAFLLNSPKPEIKTFFFSRTIREGVFIMGRYEIKDKTKGG